MSRWSDPEFPLHFRLPKEYLDEFKEVAKKEDRSLCYLARRIVIEWLDEQTHLYFSKNKKGGK